jgi:tetratricopeptide (TPR) repeat protein
MPYIRSNPKAAGLLAALFYAYGDQKSYDAAVEYGELYLAIAPQDDAFALDLAYAEMNLGHIAAARAIVIPRAAYLHAHPASADIWMDLAYKAAGEKHYHEAIADVDTYLTFRPNDASAKTQRTAFVDDIWGGPRYQNYGYAQYEGRFDDTFFGFDQTYALAPAAPVQPYAALYLTEDTRSGAPGSPQIYSDNALIADLGLRSKIGPYVTAFAEGGAGIGLRGQGTITDLRFGLRYFEQWGRRPKPYTTVAASAGFYSRYAGNYISYYQVLHDFGGKTIRPVAGINGGLDSHNIFGNNFLEAFAGAQTGNDNLTFRLVQVQGTYLLRGLNPAPKAGYSTLRGTVFFSIK